MANFISAWSPLTIITGAYGSTYFARPRPSGSTDILWAYESVDVSSYFSNGVTHFDNSVFLQSRLGSWNNLQVVNLSQSYTNNTGFTATNIVSMKLGTNSINPLLNDGAVLWIDLGSSTGSFYTLKFQGFTYIPYDSTLSNPGQINLSSQTKTILTGLTSDWIWNSNSNGFGIEWTTTGPNNTLNYYTTFFNKYGTQTSSLINITNISSAYTNVSYGSSADPYGFLFYYLDNSNNMNAYFYNSSGSLINQKTKNFIYNAGLSQVTGTYYVNTNFDTATGNYKNYEFVVTGTRNGKGFIDFYQTDGDLNLITTETISTSSAKQARVTVLQDNTVVSCVYDTTGNTLHITLIDSFGHIVQDYTTYWSTIGKNNIDSVRSLGDGRFEILWREALNTTSSANEVKSQIFDTRTSGITVTGSTTNPSLIAGTVFSDSITVVSPNSVVEGGGGADTLIASSTPSNATLSYEHSSSAVNVNLKTNTASGGDATGDIISGFSNLIGSQYNDTLTAGPIGGTLTGGQGDDILIGSGKTTALYNGNMSDYTITYNQTNYTYTVKDTVNGRDGTDTLYNVTYLKFADQTYQSLITPWSPVNIIAGSTGGTYYSRMRGSGSTDIIWVTEVLNTSSYVSGAANQFKNIIFSQSRLGSWQPITPLNLPQSYNSNNGFSDLNIVSMKFGTDSINPQLIDGGVFWLDLVSPISASYTLKFESFTFTPFDSNLPNPGSLNLPSQPITLLTGLTSNCNWAFDTKSFAIEWATKGTSNTLNYYATFFDINGVQKSSLVNLGTISSAYTNNTIANGPIANTYYFYYLDGSNNLNLSLYSSTGTPISQKSYNFIANAGWTQVTGINNDLVNYDASTGNYKNVEFVVTGARNGKGYIDFYQTDSSFNLVNTDSIVLSGSKAGLYPRTTTLPNNDYVACVYDQAGSLLHITLLDPNGHILQDFTTNWSPIGQYNLDTVRSLGDGRIELVWREPVSAGNSADVVKSQIFDTRTSAITVTGSTTNPSLIAGTVFSDSITVVSPNSVVEGGGGADTLIASSTPSNATLSYEHSSSAVNVNLKTNTASGGDATGDIISGFSNLIGSQYNDTLTAGPIGGTLTGGQGDDILIGSGKTTALYNGNMSDYTITYNQTNYTYTVKDTVNGRDGTDILNSISKLQFSDQNMSLLSTPILTMPSNIYFNTAKPIINGIDGGINLTLYEGNKVIGISKILLDGTFSISPTQGLSDGTHTLNVRATDNFGNISNISDAIIINIDTVAPISPVLSASVGSITKATQPIITGKTEAGSSVALFDGAKTIATGLAGADGNFILASSLALADGLHNLTATATDAAGNVSVLSNAISFTVDTVAPISPVLSANVGSLTKVTQPIITGKTEAGSSVALFDGTKTIATGLAGSDGSFSLAPSSAFTDGLHNITANAIDAAGNVSVLSNAISFTVDTVAPISPVLSASVGSITKVTQPIITGKTEAGSSVALFDGAKTIATGFAGFDGSFSLAPSSALTDGLHNITANATDAAGNVSALSNVISFTVNTQPSTPGVYANASKYFTISLNPTSIQVSDHTALNSVDTYSSISSIKFADFTLDTSMLTKTASLSHSNIVDLVQLYVASFNRAPDSVGLDYWGSRYYDGLHNIQGGMSLEQIAKSFFTQTETMAAYPSNMATKDFVTTVYNNVLSRGPDQGGLNYWVGQLDTGAVSKDKFLLAIINGAMAASGSAVDRQTLANKEAVGEHYAIYQGINNYTTWAKDVMSAVTDQMATVTAANAKADSYAALAANPATSDLLVKLVGVAV
jgi:Domain of unknown function (DUF4214)/Bacterial Ig-like domain